MLFEESCGFVVVLVVVVRISLLVWFLFNVKCESEISHLILLFFAFSLSAQAAHSTRMTSPSNVLNTR